MSIKRYRLDINGQLLDSNDGLLVRVCDHWKEVERLQKIIDKQSVDVKSLKKANTQLINDIDRLKPSKQHVYLVQWWYAPHDPIMAVKHYDALEDFLSDLSEDSSIIDIRVSALHPVKVTAKKVLTVQL